MTTMLPAGVGTGTITGKLTLAVEDSDDPGDAPDAALPLGTLTFTPSHKLLRGPLVLISPAPIEVDLVRMGTTNTATFTVKLLATNDPDVSPYNGDDDWRYLVSFQIPSAPLIPSFEIEVLEGVTQDLVALM